MIILEKDHELIAGLLKDSNQASFDRIASLAQVGLVAVRTVAQQLVREGVIPRRTSGRKSYQAAAPIVSTLDGLPPNQASHERYAGVSTNGRPHGFTMLHPR